jgi:hypothetical protein
MLKDAFRLDELLLLTTVHAACPCRMRCQVTLLLLLGAAQALLAATSSSSTPREAVSLKALHKFASTLDDASVCTKGGFYWHGDCCNVCPADFYFINGECAPRK